MFVCFRAALLLVVLLGAHVCGVEAQTPVPANSNIFGAGHAVAPGPGGNGGGILPALIPIPPGTNRTVQFSAAGTLDYGVCCPANGPDGIALMGVAPGPQYNGLAGADLSTRGRYLAAVFLNDSVPMDPPPDSLVFANTSFTDLSPDLRQIFFVGDGLTGEGTGTTQTFHIPDGATRLFLGVQDRCSPDPNVPGWYDDNSGTVTVDAVFNIPTGIGPGAVAKGPQLYQNYPNPFNPVTAISFSVPVAMRATLGVYDVRGSLVRVLVDGPVSQGDHSTSWDGRDQSGSEVSTGIYFVRLVTTAGTRTRKITLLK